MKIKSFIINPFLLILVSAVLSALPLTFPSLYLISWFSYIPFFYVILTKYHNKLSRSLFCGFLFGFVYHICIYYWFLWFYPLDYANLTNASSVSVIILAWFGISLLHGVLWCIPNILCHFAKKINNNPIFISAVAIIGIIAAEKLPQISELSFPWVRVSLSQYKAPILIQNLSLFGTDGADMIILLFNVLLTLSIIYPLPKRTMLSIVAVLIFTSNLIFGAIRLNTENTTSKLNIMTVQGSVDKNDKWNYDGDEVCYNIYSKLTKENITEDTNLVIWPESAVPKVYKTEKSLNKYKKLTKELDTPLIAGILMKNGDVHTNNALLIDKDGVKASYTKRHLVPFGEYMPYEKLLGNLFPFLNDLNIIENDYIGGNDTSIMEISESKIGNIICFESIYPELVRKSVNDGAEIIIEITNDSWLDDSPAIYQHLAHGVLRSIENGRYVIRSANSGISAVIDSRGRIKSTIEPNKSGVISETVYCSNEETLYSKTGDVLFPVCTILLIIVCIILSLKKLTLKAKKI